MGGMLRKNKGIDVSIATFSPRNTSSCSQPVLWWIKYLNLLRKDPFRAGISTKDCNSLSEFIADYFSSAGANEEQEEEELGDNGK